MMQLSTFNGMLSTNSCCEYILYGIQCGNTIICTSVDDELNYLKLFTTFHLVEWCNIKPHSKGESRHEWCDMREEKNAFLY